MKYSVPLLFCLLMVCLTCAHGQTYGVGFREFQVTDPVGSSKMPAVAFILQTRRVA